MFKGIYNVYSENLQYSAVKIIPIVGKNQAQQSYLILNYGEFHKTPEIFTLKASRYGNLCTSAPSLAALGIAGTSSAMLSLAQTVSQPLQNSRCRESITFPVRKFFRSNVESIKSVGAICAVFEEVFFRFGKFLASFVQTKGTVLLVCFCCNKQAMCQRI